MNNSFKTNWLLVNGSLFFNKNKYDVLNKYSINISTNYVTSKMSNHMSKQPFPITVLNVKIYHWNYLISKSTKRNVGEKQQEFLRGIRNGNNIVEFIFLMYRWTKSHRHWLKSTIHQVGFRMVMGSWISTMDRDTVSWVSCIQYATKPFDSLFH